MIFAARFALRRLARARGGGALGGAIQVVARASLGPREQLSLVRVGERLVLVGSGPGGMTPLTEVDDPDEVASLLAAAGADQEALPDTLRRRVRAGREGPADAFAAAKEESQSGQS